MADRLARIFGTEEDKINCPFFYKIGACRHGERCSRTHMRPHFSQTILIPHFYQSSKQQAEEGDQKQPPAPPTADDEAEFEDFYEEIVDELSKFGYIEQLNILENQGDHMVGNVYIKFNKEEQAENALKALTGRFYAGRVLKVEYSPVTDFREARCRQFDEDHCSRGSYCNFMHLRRVNGHLRKYLRRANRKHPSPSQSPLPDRRRGGGRRDFRGASPARRRSRSYSRSPKRDDRRGRDDKRVGREDRRDDKRGGDDRERRDDRRDDKRGGDDRERRDDKRGGDDRERRDDRRGGDRDRERERDDRRVAADRPVEKAREREEPVRSPSEERRAMIARWNAEKKAVVEPQEHEQQPDANTSQ